MAVQTGRYLLRILEQGVAQQQINPPVSPPPEPPKEQSYWTSSAGGLVLCGLFAWTAAFISCYQIYLHAINYEDAVIQESPVVEPAMSRRVIVQRYFIRIIILIPNYAVCSFFSLAFEGAAVYIKTARDMYEAFVIYSFISLLLEFIGGPGNVEAFCRDRIIHGTFLHGTCCFPPMQVDGQFVKLCKRLVLQFVIIKPVLVVLTIVLASQGLYHEGDWYVYMQIVYNFTYAAALLGLIHFWAGTRVLLKPYKPVWKFVTVKGVVFITFWQGLVLSLLFIGKSETEAKQLQTWLLCVEMLPAAIAMWFAFPAGPYMNAARNREQGGIMMAVQNVGNVVMFTDVVTDLKHQFVPQYNTYTCYKDMEQDSDGQPTTPAPTGQYRHATYVIRDPFHEQAIAQAKQSVASRNCENGTSRADGAGPSQQANGPGHLFGGMEEVPLEDAQGPRRPAAPTPPTKNPFMQDLR